MMVVGVTGGIGSGKSAVTEHFQKLGITVVDADVIARAIVAPSSPVLAAIVAQFGDAVLHPDGSLNRATLRAIIFAENTAKQQLNSIMHPAIRAEIHNQLAAATSPYVILSAPLLLENGLERLCNRVLVVDVPERVQLQRTVNRDSVNEAQVFAIMAAQLKRTERTAQADDIIDNSGSLTDLYAQVEKLHTQYLKTLNQ